MGISNGLHDLYGDSLPIVFVAAAASFVSCIRSAFVRLICSLRRLDLPHTSSPDAPLPGLLILSRVLSSFPSFSFSPQSSPDPLPGCVVCLSHLADGERVRKLSCCHVFHAECLDAWLCQMVSLSCPLCRSPLDHPPCQKTITPC